MNWVLDGIEPSDSEVVPSERGRPDFRVQLGFPFGESSDLRKLGEGRERLDAAILLELGARPPAAVAAAATSIGAVSRVAAAVIAVVPTVASAAPSRRPPAAPMSRSAVIAVLVTASTSSVSSITAAPASVSSVTAASASVWGESNARLVRGLW